VKLRLNIIIFVYLLQMTSYVQADWVTPSERVQKNISLREGPTAQSQYIGQMKVGEQLEYISSVPYWYEVRQSNGQSAYVSKAWSTLIADTLVATSMASFTIDVIDVGTGLAVLVKGDDFSLLYDGGSNDDLAIGSNNRLSAFLAAAYPNLNRINHVILSHPHRDHVQLLPDIITNFEVGDVWDSGAINNTCVYRKFIKTVANKNITYHTAKYNHGVHNIFFPDDSGKECSKTPKSALSIPINHGNQIDEQVIILGKNATMRFLHASGQQHRSYNDNSLVVRIDLGKHRILFMGDADAGSRGSWSNGTPEDDSIEGLLLACCGRQLRSDVLIAGHHGSRTSSRRGFLNAVQASTYIISSGPKKYSGITLPDQIVVDEMASRGSVYRTDRDDAACFTDSNKIGRDADNKAGGCDNIRLKLDSNFSVHYLDISD